MRSDQRSRDYVTRRRAVGLSTKEIMRCPKRFVAREVYRHLTNPATAPPVDDLRPARQAAHHTLESAAHHLHTGQTQLSRLELGKNRNPDPERRYRQWLSTIGAPAA